jgi:hypothetical protein
MDGNQTKVEVAVPQFIVQEGPETRPVESKPSVVKALREANERVVTLENQLLTQGLGQDRRQALTDYAAACVRINQVVEGLSVRSDALEIIRDANKGRLASKEVARGVLGSLEDRGREGLALTRLLQREGLPADSIWASQTFFNAFKFYNQTEEELGPDNPRREYITRKATNALDICHEISSLGQEPMPPVE